MLATEMLTGHLIAFQFSEPRTLQRAGIGLERTWGAAGLNGWLNAHAKHSTLTPVGHGKVRVNSKRDW
jgi:hypothetical protein